MNAALGILVVVLVLALAGPLIIYNRLVHLRNLTRESWRDIDTELQRRYDLVPNLVNTVKGYAAHEQQTFEAVTAQRADAMAKSRAPDEQAPKEAALGQGVTQLLAVAERYPDLKASEQFLALQRQLADTEDRIQVSRRIYNANVRAYDTLVQTFPGLLVARTLAL
jgi:LemA protein